MGELTSEELSVGMKLSAITRRITFDHMAAFERVVWDRGINGHSDAEQARREGISRPIASGQNQMAFLHELLERNFGNGWANGGAISVRYIRPVYPNDEITPNATVKDLTHDGARVCVTMDVWCENQAGHLTAAGTARAYLLDGGL